jgi:ketosteroid isomerase-like protein
MSAEDVELIRRLFERMRQGGLHAEDMVDPEIEHVRIGFDGVGLSGSWSGWSGLWEAVMAVIRVFDDFTMEAREVVDLDDRGVFVRARHRGVGRISGVPFDQDVAHAFMLRSGLIVRWHVYGDPDEAIKVLGLSSA